MHSEKDPAGRKAAGGLPGALRRVVAPLIAAAGALYARLPGQQDAARRQAALEVRLAKIEELVYLLFQRLDLMAGDITVRQDRLQALVEELLARRTALSAGGIVATEVDGFILGLPEEEWRLAAHYAFRGPLEPGLLHAFRQSVRPGMTVVDVGANVGIFTLFAARLAGVEGKVFSFEPAPRTHRILRDNVQVNGLLETGRIVLHALALSDRTATASFHVYPDDSGHNTFFPDGRPSQTIQVPTAALDEVLPPGTRVDVMKIDAEGAEPLILRGMRRVIAENPDLRIFLELAPCHLLRAGVDPAAFLHEIGGMGFRISRVEDATGDLLDVPAEALAAVFSANLCMARAPGLP